MMMNGRQLRSIDELMRNFSIDELVEGYYSGELEFFLIKLEEYEKAEQLKSVKNNAYILVRLYEILGISPELTETEIRRYYA